MRTVRYLAIAVTLLALVAAGTGAQTRERGVSATEIVIGTSQPLSGPASFWGGPVSGGMDAYLKFINDQGGIHGRKIRLVIRDDAYLPPRAVANVRELVEREQVFAIVGLIGSANTFAVRDYIIENKVLWITPNADATMWAGFRQMRYVFVAYPSYVDEGRILTLFAAEKVGLKSVSVFYQNDLYGQKGLLGVKRGAAEAKIKLATAVPYEVTDTDLSGQALKLRESRAEGVILYATPSQGARIVREMTKIGYTPKLLSSFTLGDPVMFTLAGDAWNGVYLASYLPLPGADRKVDEALATITKINPNLLVAPYNALAGMAYVEPFLEALRRAGPNLTKDGFVTAMESLKNWDGQVVRGITFGPNQHQGINRIYILQAQNKQYNRLTTDYIYTTGF